VKEPAASKVRAWLLGWYRASGRDLPWRRTRDPYRIWLSEVMLQQTTVKVVERRWPAFLERFPDLDALARASEEEVLAVWSGLGYYSRARALHRAARIVRAEHEGNVPSDPAAFRALPGVGAYTAGAVLSIAFGKREPLVDGNAARVLGRLYCVQGDASSAQVRKRLWDLARGLLPRQNPGDFNQALMELGALVCTPRDPGCGECPLKDSCLALERGRVHLIPLPRKRAAPERVVLAGALVRRRGRILLARRPDGETLLGGMWLFPGGEVRTPGAGPRLLGRLVRRILDTPVNVNSEPVARVNHSITRYRIRLLLFEARPEGTPARQRRANGACWVRPVEIGSLPVSSLVTKSLAILD
jgi:A/G-specific adenine glycosylase